MALMEDSSLAAAALVHCKLCRIERGDGDIDAKKAVWEGDNLRLIFEDGDEVVISDAKKRGFSVEE